MPRWARLVADMADTSSTRSPRTPRFVGARLPRSSAATCHNADVTNIGGAGTILQLWRGQWRKPAWHQSARDATFR